jgi:glyoxylate/hydroxypyruvate reductase A
MAFMYKADPVRGAEWARLFAAKAPQLPFHIWPDTGSPERVRYLAAWTLPEGFERQFPNVELVFSTGAGVDQFDLSKVPRAIPVVRLAEPGVVAGMAEYATMSVLALHRDLPAYMRRVSVLGMGVLGQAVLTQLRSFGVQLAGWSRSRHQIEGVACYAGQDELPAMLAATDILICLLPLTDATHGILDVELFGAMPRGASLVHVGRGAQLDHQALLDALDSGWISAAVVDVTAPEPLPTDHPFWSHPRILLTPHIASMTQPETAVDLVLENIRRHGAGAPLIGLVNREKGY